MYYRCKDGLSSHLLRFYITVISLHSILIFTGVCERIRSIKHQIQQRIVFGPKRVLNDGEGRGRCNLFLLNKVGAGAATVLAEVFSLRGDGELSLQLELSTSPISRDCLGEVLNQFISWVSWFSSSLDKTTYSQGCFGELQTLTASSPGSHVGSESYIQRAIEIPKI